jgi:hypothetical protein
MEDNENQAAAIAAVALKIIPFWPSDPQIRFMQVEAQFNIRHHSAENQI